MNVRIAPIGLHVCMIPGGKSSLKEEIKALLGG